jgi:altronate hydrolase
MSLALVISAQDNVATALEPLDTGQTVRAGEASIVVLEPVPRGHKVAVRTIARGEAVVKYGSPIGTASADIAPGAHVHIHNVASTRGRGDLGGRAQATPMAAVPGNDDPSVARIAEPPDGDQADATLTERSP